MTLTSANVRVAVTGAVYAAASGATVTAPTSPTSALDTDLKDLGYLSEDGIEEDRDRSTEDIKGHDGTVVRTVVTESSVKFKFTMIETKKETLELFYGATATEGATYGDISINTSATGGRRAFVIDTIDGSDLIRRWIPEGELSEVDTLTLANGEPVGYAVTITGYPATTAQGVATDGDAFRIFTTALAS